MRNEVQRVTRPSGGSDGLRQGTRIWTWARPGLLDLDHDDPKIFVSRRSASSDK